MDIGRNTCPLPMGDGTRGITRALRYKEKELGVELKRHSGLILFQHNEP